MKIQTTELFKIVTPDEGKCLYDGDSYTTLAYMPLDSDPESYWSERDESEMKIEDEFESEFENEDLSS